MISLKHTQFADKVSAQTAEEVSKRLLAWFREHGRHFPWRETQDPYAVLLAEKLLQRTAVRDGLVKAYSQLLSLYPTPTDLAKARVSDVLEVIQLLGLHYRANEIVTLAQAICDNHEGVVPEDLPTLLALPGVGEYSARSILCFALGRDIPIVDTNVARILYRVFDLPGKKPANPARKRSLTMLADTLVPTGKARQFNWALLDLGSSICTAARPNCDLCPLKDLCAYSNSCSS